MRLLLQGWCKNDRPDIITHMLAVFLQSIGDAIWEYSHDVRFCGMLLPHRMTVIRLSSGKLLLHSPTRCDAATLQALARLGAIVEIVAPNRFHDLFLQDWLSAAPEARLWLPRRADRSFPSGPRTQVLMQGSGDALWQREFDCLPLKGLPSLNEFAFYHRPSKSLIVADLLFNIESSARFPLRLVARLGGFYRRLAMPHDIRWWHVRDRQALKQSVRNILDLPFANIVIAHGANVLGNGRERFERAFRWLLEPGT